jgi:hypothetical protein
MPKHPHEIQFDQNILSPLPQRSIWKFLHVIITPIFLAACQHLEHVVSKICYRLVYHEEILHKFSKEGIENGIHQTLKCGRCIHKATNE